MSNAPDPLSRIHWLYHFTDMRNLPSIRDLGGLYARHYLSKKGVSDFHPGGNQWSLSADEMCGMDKYVHLCMKRKHALEHNAKQDGRIENTLWLYMDAAEIFKIEGVMFSHGVSNKSGVRICPIQEASPDIDIDVLKTYMNWSDPEVQSRLSHAELCEVLVPKRIPLKYFERFLPNG